MIASIHALLNEHLATLVGLPELQLENTRNVGKTGIPFSRATLLPARSRQLSVGVDGRDIRQGLYQVDLFFPMDTGTATINAMADSVIEHFPRGTTLTDGTTTVHVSIAWRETGSRIEPFYQVPVVVEWSSIR